MKPLRCILLNAATVLSLLSCVAIAVMWVRSASVSEIFWFDFSGTHVACRSASGAASLAMVRSSSDDGGPHHLSLADYLRNREMVLDAVERQWNGYGVAVSYRHCHVRLGRGTWTPPVPYREIEVSFGLLLGIVSILPLARVARVALRHGLAARRSQDGRCPACGYDLRATPERCPECGIIPQL